MMAYPLGRAIAEAKATTYRLVAHRRGEVIPLGDWTGWELTALERLTQLPAERRAATMEHLADEAWLALKESV